MQLTGDVVAHIGNVVAHIGNVVAHRRYGGSQGMRESERLAEN